MHFRPFPVFLAYVFLSWKLAEPNPPLLVENSTNFFFWNLPLFYVALGIKNLWKCFLNKIDEIQKRNILLKNLKIFEF